MRILAVLFAFFFASSIAEGQSSVRKIRCPRYIGVTSTGALLRKADGSYQCFRRIGTALAQGYRTGVSNGTTQATGSSTSTNTCNTTTTTTNTNVSAQSKFDISGIGQGSTPAFSLQNGEQFKIEYQLQGTGYFVLELRNSVTNAFKFRLISGYGPLDSQVFVSTPGSWIVKIYSYGANEEWSLRGSKIS